MPLPIYTYGNPGDATYSVSLASLDAIMDTTPDNTINQITAKNIRDVNLTVYEYVANNLTQNLFQVSNNGNTTSNRLELGGLQVSGTSSFGTVSVNNLRLYGSLLDISGLTGISGYILSSTNSGIQWVPNTGGTIPTLQQVLISGNTASNSVKFYGSASFSSPISISSTIQDKIGLTGTDGYILSATAGGIQWVPNTGGITPTLQQVTTTGATTSNRIQVASIQVTGTSSFTGAINIKSNLYDRNGLTGSTGWVLTSKPTGVEWMSLTTSETLNTVTTLGSTTSNKIQIGGLQVSGTSSFATSSVYGNLILYSTLTDKAGLTGPSGYILAATSNGVLWVSQNNFNQVTNLGNTTSNKIQVGGLQVNGTSSFVGTASFINGIMDNYVSTGSQYNLLTIDSTNKVKWAAAVPLLVNNVSSNYSLTASDIGKLIVVNSGSLVYITVPTNASTALPIGASIDFTRYGVGAVTFTSSAGVIINSQLGYRSITAQYVAASLIQTSANTWVLLGNLSI